MSPICKASSAASAAGGPGDAGALKEPSTGEDLAPNGGGGGSSPAARSVPMDIGTSTDSSADWLGRGESSAGSANVDPSANARLKRSLEDYEPMVVRTLVSPELPSQVTPTVQSDSVSWAGGKQTFI